MQASRLTDLPYEPDRYYTNDHEWIEFKGAVAYIGVCSFKLTRYKAIDKIDFEDAHKLFQANDVIGSMYYGDYKIDIHIPVSGRILMYNEAFSMGNKELVLTQPENEGWFALIVPASKNEKESLLLFHEYRMKTDNQC